MKTSEIIAWTLAVAMTGLAAYWGMDRSNMIAGIKDGSLVISGGKLVKKDA